MKTLSPLVGVSGASGAKLFMDEETGHVIKRDKARPKLIRQQAETMRFHGQQLFPRVIRIGEDWYEMERLYEIDDTYGGLLGEMRWMLTRIWRTRQVVLAGDYLGADHEAYVLRRAGEYADPMKKWLDRVRKHFVARVEHIHGDPTVENLMCKKDGSVCFIDPLPVTRSIPALQCVDIGKVLQSCWGYERVKGTSMAITGERTILVDEVLKHSTAGEADASKYFLCVHFLRLIPYQPTALQPFFWGMFAGALNQYGPK